MFSSTHSTINHIHIFLFARFAFPSPIMFATTIAYSVMTLNDNCEVSSYTAFRTVFPRFIRHGHFLFSLINNYKIRFEMINLSNLIKYPD